MKYFFLLIAYILYGVILIIVDFFKPKDVMKSPYYVLHPSFKLILFTIFYKPIYRFVNMFSQLISRRNHKYTFFVFIIDFIIQIVFTLIIIGGITAFLIGIFL